MPVASLITVTRKDIMGRSAQELALAGSHVGCSFEKGDLLLQRIACSLRDNPYIKSVPCTHFLSVEQG